jgi:hypothetical protein
MEALFWLSNMSERPSWVEIIATLKFISRNFEESHINNFAKNDYFAKSKRYF